MHKKQLLIMALLALHLSGCSYLQLPQSRHTQAITTTLHNTIALRKPNNNNRAVFIQISNYTNLNGTILKDNIVTILQAQKYQILANPDNADYLLQLTIGKQEINKAIFGAIELSEKLATTKYNNDALTLGHITAGSNKAHIVTNYDSNIKWRRYSTGFISKINNPEKFRNNDNVMEKLFNSLAEKIGKIFYI